ncbi:hypothetical protein BDS110ZK18_86260 [Bradyrhizobium diazoefficiens]
MLKMKPQPHNPPSSAKITVVWKPKEAGEWLTILNLSDSQWLG